MITFKFPEDFIFGTGSSAFQIEGSPYADGKGENMWDYATRTYPENFKNEAKTEPASFFYKNYEKDIQNMKEQGLGSFRLSISWTRILPEGTGRVNQAGIDFYNRVIDLLIDAGIEPFVDIYHWDLPEALAEVGGFKNEKIIDCFLEYAKICFENFGDRVKFWSTMNEPSVFCFSPYTTGGWPPFEKSLAGGLRAAHNALICHFRTVKLFREMKLPGKIGAVIDVVPIYPIDPAKDSLASKLQMERHSGWWLSPMFFGKYPDTILSECPAYREAMPEGYAEDIAREFVPIDMLGVNYYYPAFTAYDESLPAHSTNVEGFYVQEGQRFDLYPAGIFDSLMHVTEKYGAPEIYVTENGLGVLDVGDHEKNINDDDRISYIREHLRMITRAMKAGANIKGYYYWSNFDSFESRAGYTYRFGLNHINYETGERTRKKSWYYYQKVLKDGTVD